MIILRKNGNIFRSNEFLSEEETQERPIKKVKSLIPHLNEEISLEKGFNLSDFFKIIEREENLYSLIFGSFTGGLSLSAFIEEIKQDCIPENKSEIDFLICSWSAEQFCYSKFYNENKDSINGLFNGYELPAPEDDDNKIEISIFVDFFGIKTKEVDNIKQQVVYGIEYSPLYTIKDIPIILDKRFIFKKVNQHDGKSVLAGEKYFTVYDFVSAILSEITFYGYPEQRSEKMSEIEDLANSEENHQNNYEYEEPDEDSYEDNYEDEGDKL